MVEILTNAFSIPPDFWPSIIKNIESGYVVVVVVVVVVIVIVVVVSFTFLLNWSIKFLIESFTWDFNFQLDSSQNEFTIKVKNEICLTLLRLWKLLLLPIFKLFLFCHGASNFDVFQFQCAIRLGNSIIVSILYHYN